MGISFSFFCDFDSYSGYGHLIRCAELAKICLNHGSKTTLITNIPVNVLIEDFSLENAFTSIITKDLLKPQDYSNSVLVIDSYNLEKNDDIFQFNWQKIVVIKDKDTPNFNSNINITQFYEVERSSPKINEIFWPIVSQKFYEIGKKTSLNNNLIKNILVIEGGVNNSTFTNEMYYNLKKSKLNFNCKLLSNRIITLKDSRFTMSPLTYNLPELFESNDVVFSTAGNIFWQLLAARKVFGLGLQALNQKSNLDYATHQKLALPIGEYKNGTWDLKSSTILELISNEDVQRRLKIRINLEKLPGDLNKLFYFLSK